MQNSSGYNNKGINMNKPRLKPLTKKPIMGKRKSCGHYKGYTLDLTVLYNDGTGDVISYCAECIVEKLGLRPVAKHKLLFDEKHPSGKIEKIWEEE